MIIRRITYLLYSISEGLYISFFHDDSGASIYSFRGTTGTIGYYRSSTCQRFKVCCWKIIFESWIDKDGSLRV